MYRGLNIVEAFQNDPCDKTQVWRGDSFLEIQEDAVEIIPINYFGQRYLVAFSSLAESVRSDQELILEGAGIQDFTPSNNFRVIKFWPSEAEDDQKFNYEKWTLPDGTGYNALHFCKFLSQIVGIHAVVYQDCSQYFFIPSHEKLEKLYAITHRRYFTGAQSYLNNKLVLKQTTSTGGVCYGYERA